MKCYRRLLNSVRVHDLIITAFVALFLLASFFPRPSALAQNAGQVITSPTGSELIQVYPPNTAAIAYVSTSSMRNGRGYIYNVPLTGFAIVMTANQSAVSLNPAGTLATGTITVPPAPNDGAVVSIYSTQTITALTLNTSDNATFAPAVVTTIAANGTVAYVFDKAGNVWHRIQ